MAVKQPFYWVKKGDNLWNIAKQTFGLTTNSAIAQKVKVLVQLNPHLKNPDVIRANSWLRIGPQGPGPSTPLYASDMDAVSKELNSMSVAERDFIFDNWEPLCVLQREVEEAPKVLKPSYPNLAEWAAGIKTAKKMTSLAKEVGKHATKGEFGQLIKASPFDFRTVNGKIVTSLNNEIRYIQQMDGALGMIPSGSRAFQQSGRVIVANPASSGFQTWSSQVRNVRGFYKAIAKPLTVISKPLDLGFYGYNISKDWGTTEQNRTIARETGKLAAGWGTAGMSAGIGTGVCTALGVTTGVGGVGCFLIVFGGSSMTFSWAGGKIGEGIYNFGESIMNIPRDIRNGFNMYMGSPVYYFRMR